MHSRTHEKLRVLFLPAWYPSEESPAYAVFIREHARAASLHHEVVVLSVYEDESVSPWKRCQTTQEIEEGIRTIRIKCGKYRPVAASLKSMLLRSRYSTPGEGFSPENGGRLLRLAKSLLKCDGVVVGDSLYYWRVFRAYRQLLKSEWTPDVIHAHVFTAGVPAVILGRLYRIPVVMTEHWTAIPLRILTLSQRLKIRFVTSKAKMVMPVSRSLQRAIEGYGARGAFRVVPNTVDTRLFSQRGARIPSEKAETKRILLVTRLVPQKGVSDLLRAIAGVREKRSDFVLEVVGDGPNCREYELLADRIGVRDAVRFYGPRPKAEVARLMRECDFLVQSSLVETFGVVYIEAMACGKPVIASDIPGPNELIDDDMGVLVPPGDVGALAGAIDHMLDHYMDYSWEEISQHVRDRFSYESVGKMLDQVYRETVTDTKRGSAWAGGR